MYCVYTQSHTQHSAKIVVCYICVLSACHTEHATQSMPLTCAYYLTSIDLGNRSKGAGVRHRQTLVHVQVPTAVFSRSLSWVTSSFTCAEADATSSVFSSVCEGHCIGKKYYPCRGFRANAPKYARGFTPRLSTYFLQPCGILQQAHRIHHVQRQQRLLGWGYLQQR